jgi:hypothetical protein
MKLPKPDWGFFGLNIISNIVGGIWAGALLLSFAALLVSGAVFAFSGENPQRREHAMGWIRNAVIAVVILAGAGAIFMFLYGLGQTAAAA